MKSSPPCNPPDEQAVWVGMWTSGWVGYRRYRGSRRAARRVSWPRRRAARHDEIPHTSRVGNCSYKHDQTWYKPIEFLLPLPTATSCSAEHGASRTSRLGPAHVCSHLLGFAPGRRLVPSAGVPSDGPDMEIWPPDSHPHVCPCSPTHRGLDIDKHTQGLSLPLHEMGESIISRVHKKKNIDESLPNSMFITCGYIHRFTGAFTHISHFHPPFLP